MPLSIWQMDSLPGSEQEVPVEGRAGRVCMGWAPQDGLSRAAVKHIPGDGREKTNSVWAALKEETLTLCMASGDCLLGA